MHDLLKETFTYRINDEADVMPFIEQEKENSKGLVTYTTRYKTKKAKGEIIDSWYIVTITHDYTAEV